MAWVIAHQSMLLMVALSVSEVLAIAVPASGGIVKSVINILKLLGAKDQDGN
jgi:hypothetical protein